MNFEQIVGQEVRRQAIAAGGSPATPLTRDTALADTGLDSLGFTTLVIDLERALGVDPFGSDDEIVYPETFGELLDLYAAAGATGA